MLLRKIFRLLLLVQVKVLNFIGKSLNLAPILYRYHDTSAAVHLQTEFCLRPDNDQLLLSVITLKSRIGEGRNKQGGWKIPQDEISGGKSEVWANCATTNTIQKALISITESEYISESCHIYLIHYLGNSAKVLTFCRSRLEKFKS